MSDLLLKTKKIILLLGDAAVLYISLYLTLIARYGYTDIGANWEKHLLPFSLIFIIWLVIFFIYDLYDLKISYNTNNLINALIRILIINLVIAVILFYFFNPILHGLKPQRILIIDWGISLIILFFWRKIFYNLIKSPNIVNRVLVIGRSPLGNDLISEIDRRPQLGYRAANAIQMPEDLKAYCLNNNIDILISAQDLKNDQELSQEIFKCLSLGVDVYNINSFYETITNKIPVEYIEHGWFLENMAEHSKKLYELAKRFLDIILSILGLMVAIFLTPLIALGIKLAGPGPIIFKQIRTGKNGKQFLAMKFRSMVNEAEQNGPQWAQKNDPRITKFGSFMRKTRLDEIPQLINILKGEMSFIGPRPERPEFVETLAKTIPFYNERLLVRPGLTGWAQLKGPNYGGSPEETLEKLKYDLYYIKNRSFILDISIILKTIKTVLSGRGQ